MRRYRRPEPLADHHALTEFRCRSPEQTHWLHRYAQQSAATGTTRVFEPSPTDPLHLVMLMKDIRRTLRS